MKILAVEDDPVSRRILTATLERQGHEVVVAQDGLEGWEHFAIAPVEVVITDWMMPRMDGLELIRRIRARDGGRYAYLIMLTALRGRTSYLEGMTAGADDFVTKPFDKEELRARLRVAARVLGLQHEVKQLAGVAADLLLLQADPGRSRCLDPGRGIRGTPDRGAVLPRHLS